MNQVSQINELKKVKLTKSIIVNLTISWPNIVSQQSLRNSSRVTGSSVGFGVVGSKLEKKNIMLCNLSLVTYS